MFRYPASFPANLGITPETRGDHAAYLGHWLNVLKEDKLAIFSAAAHAQRVAAGNVGGETEGPGRDSHAAGNRTQGRGLEKLTPRGTDPLRQTL